MVFVEAETAVLPPYLTVGQVARYLGVSDELVRLWLREGTLRGVKTGTSQRHHWRIPRTELQRVIDSGVIEAGV